MNGNNVNGKLREFCKFGEKMCVLVNHSIVTVQQLQVCKVACVPSCISECCGLLFSFELKCIYLL